MAPDHQSTTIRRRKNCRSLRRRDGLIRHARNNTSQNGEDGIIARLFDELLPPSEQRYCVDVGARDGVHLSNTYSLLVRDEQNNNTKNANGNRRDWSGVLIEADLQRFQDLDKLHNPLENLCIGARVSCQPTSSQSLMSLLKQDLEREGLNLPNDFDFLSIDVGGIDYWVLANVLGLNVEDNSIIGNDGSQSHGYRPKVICIEFNPTMPIDLIYIQPRDDSIRHGSSLSAMVELANSADYTLVETTLSNAFFVRKELYDQYLAKEVPDTSIEALHEVTMGTELYQLYDGTTKLWGCKKMLQNGLPMDEEKMQMLSAKERVSQLFAPAEESASSNGCGEGKTKQQQYESANTRETQMKSQKIREMAIDMSSYCVTSDKSNDNNANVDSKRECFMNLNRALRSDGFALVRGTGISGSICNDALQAAKSFMNDADESVRRSCLTKDRARRGYSPMCTENFASLIGKQGPNDLVKKFRIGPESNNHSEDDSKLHSLSSLHQSNSWPTDEVWGHENAAFFQSTVEQYFERTCHAADCILRAICDGITAKNADISDSIEVLSQSTQSENDHDSKKHTSILTVLGYQPGSRHKKGSKGYMRPLISAHTDVGVITVLHFDNGKCASLQRAADASNNDPENNEWIDVNLPPILGEDPVFVVNVGDCLSELSGGSLRSTLHRVMPHPFPGTAAKDDDVARTCLAMFVGLEPSASLVLPSGEVISYEKWRQQRIARATAVLKSNS